MGATTLVERRTTMQPLGQPSTHGRTWKRAGRRSRKCQSPHYLLARCLRLECHSSHTPSPLARSLISTVNFRSVSFPKMETGYSGVLIGEAASVLRLEVLRLFGRQALTTRN